MAAAPEAARAREASERKCIVCDGGWLEYGLEGERTLDARRQGVKAKKKGPGGLRERLLEAEARKGVRATGDWRQGADLPTRARRVGEGGEGREGEGE